MALAEAQHRPIPDDEREPEVLRATQASDSAQHNILREVIGGQSSRVEKLPGDEQ